MDKRIENLLLTIDIMLELKDYPVLWKFNKNYLDVLCMHLNLENHESLFIHGFMDVGIDLTSRDSFCIGSENYYPLLRSE